MYAAAATLCVFLLLLGCSSNPCTYAPPAQFVMPRTADAIPQVLLVKMNDPETSFNILDGVFDAGHGWGLKWTSNRAHFQLLAGDLGNTDFFMRYALDSMSFRDRGPIRFTVAVDGQVFDTWTEPVLGVHVHRRPATSLQTKGIRTVDLSLTVDPPWISRDGTKIGIYLDSIGFVPRTEVREITMKQPEALFNILDGVIDPGDGWGFKWTQERAHFQLLAANLANSDFFVRYSMDPTTLHDRGSIRINVAINGRPFDSWVESSLGEHVHRRPAETLTSKELRTLDVELAVDPPWVSKDGTKLGVFLDSIGFMPRQ